MTNEYSDAERDAMIDTIRELEKDRDALRQVARMALQQFEFTYGKRSRGWDAQFLMERLQTTIAESEGTAPAPPVQPASEDRPIRCVVCGHYGNVVDGKCREVGTVVVQGGEAATTCDCECVFPAPVQPEGEQWVCFHCNTVLTGHAEVESHFGVGRSIVKMLAYLHQGAGEPECQKQATPSTTVAPKCGKCGHEGKVSRDGWCRYRLDRKPDSPFVEYCGCKCVFLQPATTTAAARAAATEIAKEFQLVKEGWVTFGRVKIDHETETATFERTNETAVDRILAILSKYFAAVPVGQESVLSQIAAMAHEGVNITAAGTHSLLAEIEEVARAAISATPAPDVSEARDGAKQLIQDMASFPFDILMDENAPRSAVIGSVSTLRHMQARARQVSAAPIVPTGDDEGETSAAVRLAEAVMEVFGNPGVSPRTWDRLRDVCAAALRKGESTLGHIDFIFDDTPCCKVCGLVKPAEGWTRSCKGPSELSLRDEGEGK